MNIKEVKKRFHTLHTNGKRSRKETVNKIKADLRLDESPEKILCVALQPTPEETKRFVKENKLWCDVCDTDQHIVGEPVGLDEEGKLSKRIEYYCANKTKSTVFSKCWNHVYSYFYGNRRIVKCTV